jgi:hypothetical protein
VTSSHSECCAGNWLTRNNFCTVRYWSVCIYILQINFYKKKRDGGTRWRSGWGTALQTGRSRVRFPMVSQDFFYWRNNSGRTMALGSTQPLTVLGIFPGGKGGRCVGLTTLPPSCADCLEIWNPQGLSRSVMGLLYSYFTKYL